MPLAVPLSKKRKLIQALAVGVTLMPATALVAQFAINGPGANPIEEVTHVTGEWGLRFVLLSLAITPARQFFGWRWAPPLRRTIGLAGFCYAALHLATYAYFDLGLDKDAIFEDLTERPYVMVGMAGFVLLLILAMTSTQGWMKRLGSRWHKLHKLVYVAATLGVAHHFWLIKADYRPAIVHGALLVGLLGARMASRSRKAVLSPG